MSEPRRPLIVCMADVPPEDVPWLWRPYIPRGRLTFLEGDPGVGKSWLALALATHVSLGLPFPHDGEGSELRQEPGNVLYLSAEDGLGDTIRKRLDAMQADVNRVHALIGWQEGEHQGCITLGDLGPIERAIQETSPALVVIDPIQAYLGASVDMHRANEVRPVLQGLHALADQHGCAMVILRHLTKSIQTRAIYHGMGSIDFAAAARSILLAGLDPKNPHRRVVAQCKSSLAASGRSITYQLKEGGFFWAEFSDLSADDLLRASDEEPSAIEEASDFLKAYLAEGEKPAKEVISAAKKAGISEASLKRARKEIAKAMRASAPGGKKGEGQWVWTLLPNTTDQGAHDEQDGHEPLRGIFDLLDHDQKSLGNQDITATNQEAHMNFLVDEVNVHKNQTVKPSDQEAHPQPLERTDQEDHRMNGHRPSAKGDADVCLNGHQMHPAHKRCFLCQQPRKEAIA
jgi:AAA domain